MSRLRGPRRASYFTGLTLAALAKPGNSGLVMGFNDPQRPYSANHHAGLFRSARPPGAQIGTAGTHKVRGCCQHTWSGALQSLLPPVAGGASHVVFSRPAVIGMTSGTWGALTRSWSILFNASQERHPRRAFQSLLVGMTPRH